MFATRACSRYLKRRKEAAAAPGTLGLVRTKIFRAGFVSISLAQ